MKRFTLSAPFLRAGDPTPNIGLALQGGGKFCVFHKGVESHLTNSTLYPHISARTDVSGGSIHSRVVKSNLIDGTPENIQDDLERLYQFIARNENGLPFIKRGLDGASDTVTQLQRDMSRFNPMTGLNFWLNTVGTMAHSTASLSGMAQDFSKSVQNMAPETVALERLKRIVTRISPDREELLGDDGFAHYTSSTAYDKEGTLANHSYRNPTTDEIIRSCALKQFGNYQGHFDGAYLFNPHLDRMIQEQDLTDLILISTNPYDPRLPKASQAELRDHEHAHESGLKYSEALSEMQVIEERYGIYTHGICLPWEPEWRVSDKIFGSPALMAEIETKGVEISKQALGKIEANIARKSTYDPRPATLPTLLEPAAA